MKLVFATNSAHKIAEVKGILGNRFEILSLAEIGCNDDIPETADTLEGNAFLKARWVKEKYGYDCFADDTGLEVAALGGAPGVHSARYAGNHDSEANMVKLISELSDKSDRSAQFRTAVALILNGQELLFEGIVKGRIAQHKQGTGGFGYDPVFIPEGYDNSFAELGLEVKNKISHRARAVGKLVDYLSKL